MDGEHVEPVTPDESKAFTERVLRCLDAVLDADAEVGYLLVSGLRMVDSAATPDDDVERREEYEAAFVVRLTELDALLRQIRQPEIERLVETIKLAPNRPQPPPDLVHGEFFPTDRTTYCEAGIRLAGAYLFACKYLCRAWGIELRGDLVEPIPPPMLLMDSPEGLVPHWRQIHDMRRGVSELLPRIREGVRDEALSILHEDYSESADIEDRALRGGRRISNSPATPPIQGRASSRQVPEFMKVKEAAELVAEKTHWSVSYANKKISQGATDGSIQSNGERYHKRRVHREAVDRLILAIQEKRAEEDDWVARDNKR